MNQVNNIKLISVHPVTHAIQAKSVRLFYGNDHLLRNTCNRTNQIKKNTAKILKRYYSFFIRKSKMDILAALLQVGCKMDTIETIKRWNNLLSINPSEVMDIEEITVSAIILVFNYLQLSHEGWTNLKVVDKVLIGTPPEGIYHVRGEAVAPNYFGDWNDFYDMYFRRLKNVERKNGNYCSNLLHVEPGKKANQLLFIKLDMLKSYFGCYIET